MPYSKISKSGNKFCFTNRETGQKRCSDTLQKAVAQMRLLYGVESGMKPSDKTGKPFKVRLKLPKSGE